MDDQQFSHSIPSSFLPYLKCYLPFHRILWSSGFFWKSNLNLNYWLTTKIFFGDGFLQKIKIKLNFWLMTKIFLKEMDFLVVKSWFYTAKIQQQAFCIKSYLSWEDQTHWKMIVSSFIRKSLQKRFSSNVLLKLNWLKYSLRSNSHLFLSKLGKVNIFAPAWRRGWKSN